VGPRTPASIVSTRRDSDPRGKRVEHRVRVANLDHARCIVARQRHDAGRVEVPRHDHVPALLRQRDDHVVGGLRITELRPVGGVEPLRAETRGPRRPEVHVDEELHATG